MDQARAGVFRAVHLIGEAGVGKTTLAERVADLAASQGWLVARGCAWHNAAAPPYWVWAQVLDAMTHAAAAPVDTPLLALVTGTINADAIESDPTRGRTALILRFVSYLRAVAGSCPTLLILDDLHEADADSVTLAAALARGIANRPILMLTTQRPLQHPGAVLLDEVNRHGRMLPVGCLDRNDVAAVVAALRPDAVKDVGRLYEATGGNPFFLTHMLRGPSADMAVRGRVGEWLAALGEHALQVVTVAAVIGSRTETGLLAEAVALPPDCFLAACAEAVRAGVLQPTRNARPGYQFVHALLREAAYQAMPHEQRQRWHMRVAEAIAMLAPYPGSDWDLAHHLRGALPLADLEQAMSATVTAAGSALRRFAVDAAAEACTAGLAAIAPHGQPSTRWRIELLTLLGEAHACRGDADDAWSSLLDAHQLATRHGERVLAAEAVLRLPRRRPFLRPEPDLHAHLRRAVDELGDAAPALQVRLLNRILTTGDDEQRAPWRGRADDTVAAARRLGDPHLLAESLDAWLYATWGREALDVRLAVVDELVAIGVDHGDVARELDGRLWRFTILLELGRVNEADLELCQYEHAVERVDQPRFELYARSRRSTLAALRGQLPDAERLAREAHALARAIGEPDADYLLGSQLSPLAQWKGGSYVTELLEWERGLRFAPLLSLAVLCALAGQEAEARALLPTGLAGAGAVPKAILLTWCAAAAETAYLLADRNAATVVQQHFPRNASVVVVGSKATVCWGAAARVPGLCALVLGELDSAVVLLEEAVARDRALGTPLLMAAGQAALADALLRRANAGDAERAGRLLAEADAAAAAFDAPGLAARVGRVKARAVRDTPRPDLARLDRDGDGWRLTYRARSTHLPARKGIDQLATLLSSPGREISAVELAGGHAVPAVAEPILDGQGMHLFQRRRAELDELLRRADASGDQRAAEEASRERDALVATLKQARGLGGRTRVISDDDERARINVARTIRQALDRILVADPDAHLHLLATIRTGHRCCYNPGTDGGAPAIRTVR